MPAQQQLRTVVILGGLSTLFVGCLMMIYAKTWVDILFLLSMLLVFAITPVYAAMALHDAHRMERG
uniref:Uncharacterized protein n=1 Tax=Leersia perrieri TaxID=77586 RepID=A0A0D9WVX9_9ORYZ